MQGLKRIAEELQAMQPEMAAMADKLAHYDLRKYMVTLIHGDGRTEFGVLAPNPGEAVRFVMDGIDFPVRDFAIICKGVA